MDLKIKCFPDSHTLSQAPDLTPQIKITKFVTFKGTFSKKKETRFNKEVATFRI